MSRRPMRPDPERRAARRASGIDLALAVDLALAAAAVLALALAVVR